MNDTKIIIHNRSKRASDVDALLAVCDVIKMGRISGDGRSYCYLTRRRKAEDEKGIMISAKRNRKSDNFTIYDEH